MELQLRQVEGAGFSAAALQGRRPFSIDDLVLRHLRTPADIARVLHLREEIDLSVHAAAGPHFATLEKKETSAGLCSVLNSTGN
ncbi:MAG: hypothetical protein JWO88_4010 [Frankiales bacterium]|jgi:hypothetical protein|nr:hypothetical protein [Frankiales bacterium]